MFRIGRFVIDIIGAAIGFFGLILGIVTYLGKNVINVRDLASFVRDNIIRLDKYQAAAKTLLNGDKAHFMGVSAILLGMVVLLIFVICTLMIFRANSHKVITITLYLLSFITVGIGLTGFLISFNLSDINSLVHNVVTLT